MQLAAESVEIKQLKHEIEAAKLNQERAIQVAESQFRRQVNLEKETEMEWRWNGNKLEMITNNIGMSNVC